MACPLVIVLDPRSGKRLWSGVCKLCEARVNDVSGGEVFDWFAQHVCSDPVRRDGWMPSIRQWQATVAAENVSRE